MKIVDTGVAIDHLRGDPAASRLLRELELADETVVASELTRFELVAGVHPDEVQALEDFSITIDWVPVTEMITRAAGELARRWRPRHRAIDDIDFLIAGTAVVLEAELLTINVRHFPMFEGLAAPY